MEPTPDPFAVIELDVPYAVLREARDRWAAAADELDRCWRRLARASTSGLSAAVTRAVEEFRDPCADELKALGGQAQDHADAFVLYGGQVVLADREQAERLRALLPWAEHAAQVVRR
ncbi:hypothetical protein GCM10022237_16120 [Nocardioides ginsengisoli]|uniref:PE domain-containing protein n=1 Tax=Nocardioides ginsengisoli TaxID=363868 RepID=A0ABW3W3E3_9ACTN